MYNEYVFTNTTRIVHIAPHKLNNTYIGARHTILYIYNKSNSYKFEPSSRRFTRKIRLGRIK